MLDKFSKVIDDLFYNFSIAEIKIEHAKQQELSHNTMLYRKIICKESGKHTISSIAKLLSVKTTAVTQKVNELETKNYVTRKQSEADKRISYLYGVEKHCPCHDAFVSRDSHVLGELQKQYNDDEIAKFIEMLQKTNEHYMEFDLKEGE